MIMNVSLLSILLNTESVAQNCWKGISFSWRTLSGTFLREHLQHYPNIKQRCEMLHYTAIPSSACVAYRMNFNDNFDIFWGRRKLFQEDGIHWSQLGAKVQCKNVLHGLRILPLKSKVYPNPCEGRHRNTWSWEQIWHRASMKNTWRQRTSGLLSPTVTDEVIKQKLTVLLLQFVFPFSSSVQYYFPLTVTI